MNIELKEFQPPKIVINYDELKAELEKNLEVYKGIVVTEEMKDPDEECHEGIEPNQQEYLVDGIKIKVIKDLCKKKGVSEKQVKERYGLTKFEEMSIDCFKKAYAALEKTPDVEQVDLGL